MNAMLIVNFITSFLLTLAYAILYRKYRDIYREYRDIEGEYSELKRESRCKLRDELFSQSLESAMREEEINHLKKENQEWKKKYLDVLEQNLRLAEKIGSDTK